MDLRKAFDRVISQLNNPVAICTIISLVLSVFCVLRPFRLYGNPYVHNLYILMQGILPFILVAAIVLFAAYTFVFHKQSRAKISVPVILGLMSLYFILDIFSMLWRIMFWEGYISFSLFLIVLCDLPLAGSFVFAIVKMLKRKLVGKHIKFAVSCGLVRQFVFLGSDFIYYDDFLFVFISIMCLICFSSFYIAMLFFFREVRSKEASPEKVLRQLQKQFETGAIAEEEYRDRRAEIISRL